MKKKIVFGIIAFIIGIGISVLTYSFFREQIQNIFLLSTSNRIRFTGKNFYLFGGSFYSLSMGISLLVLTLDNLNQGLIKILMNLIVYMLIFVFFLIGFSIVDANMKVVECTACDNGIRNLHWNEINYGLIIGLSAIIAIIPSLVRMIKQIKSSPITFKTNR